MTANGCRRAVHFSEPAGQGIKRIPDWVWTGGPRPQKDRYTFTTWKFYNRDTPLLESGLLGPVSLQTAVSVPAK